MDCLNSSFDCVPPLPLLESLDDIKGRLEYDLEFPPLNQSSSCGTGPNGIGYGNTSVENGFDSSFNGSSSSSISCNGNSTAGSDLFGSLVNGTSLPVIKVETNGSSTPVTSTGVDKLINGNSVGSSPLPKTYSTVGHGTTGSGNSMTSIQQSRKVLNGYSATGTGTGLINSGQRLDSTTSDENEHSVHTTQGINHNINTNLKRGGSLSSEASSVDSVSSSELHNNNPAAAIFRNGHTYGTNGGLVMSSSSCSPIDIKSESLDNDFDTSSDLSLSSFDDKIIDNGKSIEELLSDFPFDMQGAEFLRGIIEHNYDQVSSGLLGGGFTTGNGLYTTPGPMFNSGQTLIGHLTEQQYPGITSGTHVLSASNHLSAGQRVSITGNGSNNGNRVNGTGAGGGGGQKRKNGESGPNGQVKRINSSTQNSVMKIQKTTKAVKKAMANGIMTANGQGIVTANGMTQIKKRPANLTGMTGTFTTGNNTLVTAINGRIISADGTILATMANGIGPGGNMNGGAKVAKCRKQFGQSRRDLWCAQCKWKKACSRVKQLNN